MIVVFYAVCLAVIVIDEWENIKKAIDECEE
jgi:hypothetical protein